MSSISSSESPVSSVIFLHCGFGWNTLSWRVWDVDDVDNDDEDADDVDDEYGDIDDVDDDDDFSLLMAVSYPLISKQLFNCYW